jgi:two-component sensor histidine kinase
MMTSIIPPALGLVNSSPAFVLPFQIFLIILGISYGLSRTRHYRTGVVLTVVAASALPIVVSISEAGYSPGGLAASLMWIVIPLLLGSMVLSRRNTVIMAGIIAAGILLLPVFIPELPFLAILPVLAFIVTGVAMHIISLLHADRLETERQAELEQALDGITKANETLQAEITRRKQVEADLRQRHRDVTTLYEASTAISSNLSLDGVLQTVAEQMAKAFQSAGCTISLWDREQNLVRTLVDFNSAWPEDTEPPDTSHDLNDFPATRRVLETGQTMLIQHDDPTADEAELAILAEWEAFSLLMLPLSDRDQTIGLVELINDVAPRVFTPDDIRLAQSLAAQAAVAIENARLHAETERRLREQTALREASAALSSTLDFHAVLTRITEQMGKAINATSAYICSHDPKTNAYTVLAEYISPQACAREKVSDLGITAIDDDPDFFELMEAGQYDISQIDDPNLFEADRAHMEQYGGKSILYIPLLVKGRLVGYTELWESRHRREFTPEEIALCQGISQQAAIALENAQLYEQAQQEIIERRRAEKQIEASLKEKEVLLQEIHHRVKNNLQVISSLLNLQSGYVEDQQTLEIFQDSQNRVRSMALIHEKLYQTENLARIEFAEYIGELTSYLFRSHPIGSQGINLNIETDNVFLDIDTAVPCGIILNELVSNSLKHAFPGNRTGQIRVELRTDEKDQLILIVADNGVGLPETLDLGNTPSLGLQLVNSLASQIDGTIELGRHNGTEFKITFAVSEKKG